jgi:NDP-sugar pyrophosphorylase family protein
LTAIILAGGKGTRLRSVLPSTPKAVAPIHGKPFLDWVLCWLAGYGVSEVIIASGHLNEILSQKLGDLRQGISISYSIEESPLGTGGALRLASKVHTGSTILCINGDTFCPLDLNAFLNRHQSQPFKCTLALTEQQDVSRYGMVEINEQGRITRFLEKGALRSGYVSAGIYLIDRSLVDSLPEGPISLEKQCFPSWITRGIGGYTTDACFLDIGVPEDYAKAETILHHLQDGL